MRNPYTVAGGSGRKSNGVAGKEQTMRCVDCEKHSFVANTHWCDATKKPKRVSDEDAYKDVPCKRGKLKGVDNE